MASRFFTLTSILVLLLLPLVGCNLQGNGDADVDAGLRFYDERNFAEAIPHFESALNKPLHEYTRSTVLTTIGNCYYELDELEKSLNYHDQAIKADSENHQAYVNKGVTYRLMGDYDAAAKNYAIALTLAPNYAELHGSVGALALFREDYEGAVTHLERAIELNDSLAVAHSNLAIAYAYVGRFEDADNELRAAILRGYHQPEVIQTRIDQLQAAAESKK